MNDFVNAKNAKYSISIDKPVECDGGRVLIERLIHLFKVKNRLELADVIGVTSGTISTWTTRNTTPYEVLLRIHLATGVPMEYLCFGTGKSYSPSGVAEEFSKHTIATAPAESIALPKLALSAIENGKLIGKGEYKTESQTFELFGIEPSGNDFALDTKDGVVFISSRETAVSKGQYLFSINDVCQLGELRQLPDGNTYYFDEDERYPINPEVTKVIGKVTGVLTRV